MGNLNYIVFGGIDSRDYGIYISGEGVFNAPERDVEVVNIPGKDGDLLIDRGRFLNIQVTYPGFNFEPDLSTFAERLRAFRAALTSQIGYQRLEDSFHPDEFRLASFRSGLDVNPVMYNTASTFDIVFDCKPQRFLKSGEEEITITSGDELDNPSPFEALPLIEVVGVGSLAVGNITVTITGESTQDIFIDSDIMEAYEDDNGAIISRNDRISLSGMNFPTLGTDTGITYTGLTSVKVTPRWWTI